METSRINTVSLAVVIVTHQYTHLARQQMDSIRTRWQPHVGHIDIFHEYNGLPQWYRRRHREDFLFRHPPMDHRAGAVYLINQGIAHVLDSAHNYDYIIVSSSDVRITQWQKIYNLLTLMNRKHYFLATSVWFWAGFACEFFIITPILAQKIFPLSYRQDPWLIALLRRVNKKYARLFPIVELRFFIKAVQVLGGKIFTKTLLIPGRKLVMGYNRFYSPHFAYRSDHPDGTIVGTHAA